MLTAEDLLVTTGLSFTEITYRVGYTSVGTFSTRFKLVTGMSPSRYRAAFDPSTSPLRGGRISRGDTRLVLGTMRRAEAGRVEPQQLPIARLAPTMRPATVRLAPHQIRTRSVSSSHSSSVSFTANAW